MLPQCSRVTHISVSEASPSSVVQVMACCLIDCEPLPQPRMSYCQSTAQCECVNKARFLQCHATPIQNFLKGWGRMSLLPNTSNCGCACAGNARNGFPATTGKQSRYASRHVRDARAVMHAGIANSRFPFNSAAGENVPGIPGACATRNFTYLVRGPWCGRLLVCSSWPRAWVKLWNLLFQRKYKKFV